MNGVIAWLLLVLIFCGPAFIKWCVDQHHGASPSTEVSRNPVSDKWEQDEPWPECFDEMFEEDDDL